MDETKCSHEIVKSEHIKTSDFMKVVKTMNKNSLIKGCNVSRYNYYIIRLCLSGDIKLLKIINNMKQSKTR